VGVHEGGGELVGVHKGKGDSNGQGTVWASQLNESQE
jgi:hypothetical protein